MLATHTKTSTASDLSQYDFTKWASIPIYLVPMLLMLPYVHIHTYISQISICTSLIVSRSARSLATSSSSNKQGGCEEGGVS